MKHVRSAAFLILAATLLLTSATAWAGAIDSVEPCVVFLTREAGGGKASAFGTGFLVDREGRPYLVTASHVAKDLGADFKIVMPGEGGRPVVDRMQGVKWIVSPSADVAYTGIDKDDHGEIRKLLQRSIPAHFLTARSLPPSRDISLIAVGYPLGLGSKGYVSPLTLETRAASGFITLKRFDNHKDATFILLQSPSVSGLSGGPVFDVGRPLIEGGTVSPREGISLVGLVSGVIWDKTGGKFAMIVPATEISKLFDSASPQT
ncbi:MAG TPA: serine protease [Deltaproteobacteria bacterium]|jgi:hypothetical protein|nr:serine protease [Deltaproteobacteria bacterium]HOI06188.1 serine protease [Deltaproteobacteria bacterium]